MKKIIVLLSLFTVFNSCYSDDNLEGEDPIIGIWKFTELVIDGRQSPLEKCSKLTTFTYFNNGTGIQRDFFDNVGVCELSEIELTWENLQNSKYNLNGAEFEVIFSDNNDSYTQIFELILSDNEESRVEFTYSRI